MGMAGRRGVPGLERLKADRHPMIARLASEAEWLIEGLTGTAVSSHLSRLSGISMETRRNPGNAGMDHGLDRRRRLERWMQSLATDTILVTVTRSVLFDRMTFGALDRRFHRRNGWARDQLIRALELLDRLDTSGA